MADDKRRLWATGNHRKVAATIPELAELLDIPEPMAERLANQTRPYRHHDGSPRWSVREVARLLADCGGQVPPELVRLLPVSETKQARSRRRRRQSQSPPRPARPGR